MVIPPLVNTFIGSFKDTSLVIIIGLFDLTRHASNALNDRQLARLLCRGLCLRRRDLFELLLLHVALQPDARARAQRRRRRSGAATAPLKRAAMIELRNVHKWYGEFHVLKDISLQVGKGERVVVCGPSGSGKSTMIRCINRLEEHQAGHDHRRRHRARPATQEHRGDPPRGRHGVPAVQPVPASDGAGESDPGADLGAQDAEEARPRRPPCTISSACASPSRREKYPGQLSGGQQQRVAIARSLCMKPQDHAVRRADLGARSRDDQGGARRDGRAGAGGHDHGLRHPRDGLRPHRRRHDGVHGPRRDRRARARRRNSSPTRRASAPSCSSARS